MLLVCRRRCRGGRTSPLRDARPCACRAAVESNAFPRRVPPAAPEGSVLMFNNRFVFRDAGVLRVPLSHRS